MNFADDSEETIASLYKRGFDARAITSMTGLTLTHVQSVCARLKRAETLDENARKRAHSQEKSV